MRKLTAIGLSLLFCLGSFAQPPALQKASRQNQEDTSPTRVFEGREISVRSEKTPDVAERTVTKARLSSLSPKGAPDKALRVSPNIYAGIIYPSNMYGISKIDAETGSLERLVAATGSWNQTKCMAIKDQTIYLLGWYMGLWGNTAAYLCSYDLSTGSLLKSIDLSDSFDYLPQGGSAYNPQDNCIYGYSNKGLSKMDVSSGQATVIAQCDTKNADIFSIALTWNLSTNEIIGWDKRNGDIYKVDTADGSHFVLGNCGKTSHYDGGIGYDITSDSYIINPNDNAASELYAVNAGNYSATYLCALQNKAQTCPIVVNETERPDQEAPRAPEFAGSSFPNGALFGQISFILPTEYNSGEEISGSVEYVVKADDTEVASGSGNPGARVVSNIMLEQGGEISFTITALQNGHVSKACEESVYIGNDTPLAPSNVKLSLQSVSWNPVVKGIHNGYLDLQKMTYTVKINGELVAEGLTATDCAPNLPLNVELSDYVAEVYAVCHGLVSAPGSSNSILFGEAYSVPVSIEPTAEQAELFTVADANKDGKTWTYYPSYDAFRYYYHSRNNADDWLFLPPVKITDTTKIYEFCMDAWSSLGYAEKFEVYVGREATPEAMTKLVIPTTEIKFPVAEKKPFSGTVDLPETGKWYFAVKAVSDKDKLSLFVNNFRITKSDVFAKGPAAVTDVVGKAGAEGALTATVTFRLPTVDNTGTPLKGSVSAEVENLVDFHTVTGEPGSLQSVTMKCQQSTDEGIDPILITTKIGDLTGYTYSLSVWTGVDIPATPRNARIIPNEENNGGVFTWDLVSEGANGGYIEPGDVKYYLCQYQVIVEGYLEGWKLAGEIGVDVDEMEFEYAGALETLRLGVAVGNEAGMNPVLCPAFEIMGPALATPALETFKDGGITYKPVLYAGGEMEIASPRSAGAVYADPSVPFAAIITKNADLDYAYYALPPFSTLGASKIAFTPKVYIGSCANYRVTAEAYGIPETEIFNLADMVNYDGTAWQDLVISLPAQFQNKHWVNLKIYGDMTSSTQKVLIGGYQLRNMVPYDLMADKIAAPSKVKTGSDYDVTVTARNIGLQAINSYSVKLYEDGELVETKEGFDLPSDASENIVFRRSMSPVASAETRYYAVVSCPNDSNQENEKTATIAVAPKVSALPGVTELQAGNGQNGVTLTWLEPESSITGESVTEDFEDADSFSDLYGDWIFVDRDNSEVGGFQGTDIPGITPGTTKGSFWIWDSSIAGNQTFEAHSGTKYLFSLFRYDDGQVDDWAITPELSGAQQTISFYARSYSAQYPESIEVYYSDGSVDPEDFTKIEGFDGENIPDIWTLFEAEVPEGARRFAIRSMATGSFVLMVDDVTFSPAGAGTCPDLLGYDVYRDGVKINDALVTNNDYEDPDVVVGTTYTYQVVASFDLGYGKPSNQATITYDSSHMADLTDSRAIHAGKGFIRLCGFKDMNVSVATADGVNVVSAIAGDDDVVPVPAGIYIVKAGNRTAKVAVR